MENTKITMAQHFAIFNSIATFMDENTTLNPDQCTEVAARLLESICTNANLEMELQESDCDFLIRKLFADI